LIFMNMTFSGFVKEQLNDHKSEKINLPLFDALD
jgi:hypothetical protein